MSDGLSANREIPGQGESSHAPSDSARLQTNTEAEEDAYPSMSVVRAELDVELGLLERRSAAVDTKAGLVLGFAGVLVGLTKDVQSWITVAGQVLAVLAAVLAITAFLPRYGGAVNPMTLRQKYLTTDKAVTELSVLDTRLIIKERDEAALRVKARRVRMAVVILVLAIAVIVASSVVHQITGKW